MLAGDHIRVMRLSPVPFWHHGIFIGGGRVIHYSGEVGSKSDASVCEVPLAVFLDGGNAEVVEHRRCDPPHVVLARARSKVGEKHYNLISNNCEHFAFWCKTGIARSVQVEDAADLVSPEYGLARRLMTTVFSEPRSWHGPPRTKAETAIEDPISLVIAGSFFPELTAVRLVYKRLKRWSE